tara:strand:+ start:454 stop:651 length:198 start_codon:yes stop_codon:yes gene_type:complete
VKVSDLVQYDDKYVESDVGVVMRSWSEDRYGTDVYFVDVLWTGGEVVTHYASDFKVISEGSYENR